MNLIEIHYDYVQEVLNLLLKDKSSNKNIIWAVNNYLKYGVEYSAESELTYESINCLNIGALQPRVSKSKELQKGRTKDKAEVFTPSHICDEMNTYCDNEWVKKKFKGKCKTLEDVDFSDKKVLLSYIGLKKLEITCGEGPFIISRYDTTTGEILPIEKRIGFLDRKLKLINKYIDDTDEWFELVYKAYQSSYGYEYQGDNLVKVRLNLFHTFVEYFSEKWNNIGFPTDVQLKKISNLICWNFWQMDGLKNTVPLKEDKCKIQNWSSKKSYYFEDLEGEGCMKFDYIIGNPPYQEKVNESGKGLGAKPLYDKFVQGAIKLNPKYICMIIPARWYAGGVGLNNFREMMLQEKHIISMVDFIDSKECFNDVDINGGVCYFLYSPKYVGNCTFINVSKDKKEVMERDLSEFEIFIRMNMGVQIINKILKKTDKTIFSENGCSSQTPYGFISSYRGTDKKINNSDYKLLTSEGWTYVKDIEITKGNDTKDMYKTMISKLSCEHAGVPDKNGMYRVLSRMEILEKDEICNQSYLVICPSYNKEEVNNVYKYLKTKFVRILILLTLVGMNISTNNFRFVPMQDFTDTSDIDWTKSIKEINQQLYNKYALNEKEIDFIEEKIREMD